MRLGFAGLCLGSVGRVEQKRPSVLSRYTTDSASRQQDNVLGGAVSFA